MYILNLNSALSVLALLASVQAVVKDARKEDALTPTALVGPPRSTAFNDQHLLDKHKRLSYIALYGCNAGEHLEAIEVGYRDNSKEPKTLASDIKVTHGKYGKYTSKTDLSLTWTEYINAITVATYKKKVGMSRRTRVGYIRISTTGNRNLECGSKSDSDPTYHWPAPNTKPAFFYFAGNADDDVDALQAYFGPEADF